MLNSIIKCGDTMTVAIRNRKIKKALEEVFGTNNVHIRGGLGTAYGWVTIYIFAPKPHSEPCGWKCDICRLKREEITNKVWQTLKHCGLDKEIYYYYDDMGEKRPECTIVVNLS